MVDGEGIIARVVEDASRLPGPAGVGRPAEHRRSPEWEQRQRDLQTLPGGVGQTRFDRVGGNGLLVGLARRAGLLVEQNRPVPVPAAVERTRDRHSALTAGAVRVGVVERQGCNIEHPTIGRKGRPRIGGALIGTARGQCQPRHQAGPPVLAGIPGDRDADCPRPRVGPPVLLPDPDRHMGVQGIHRQIRLDLAPWKDRARLSGHLISSDARQQVPVRHHDQRSRDIRRPRMEPRRTGCRPREAPGDRSEVRPQGKVGPAHWELSWPG